MVSSDTSIEAQAAQAAVYRRMGPARRLELGLQLSDDARAISRAGIRTRHPDYSDDEVEHALRRLLLGDDLFRAAWPYAPLLPA